MRGGRRSGKTVLVSDIAIERFLSGTRVLYATPTQEQLDRFWHLTTRALAEPIAANIYKKNETLHTIELPGTDQHIRAKTAWSADTLRGDFGDLVILDEYQDMKPDVLDYVIWPMLLDNDGDLIVIYTAKRGKKGKHTRDLYQRAINEKDGRWEAFHMTSLDNPFLSQLALAEITQDMPSLAYRAEILAEDFEDDPNALWNRELINQTRVLLAPQFDRILIGVDPPGGPMTECGICVAGGVYIEGDYHIYIIADPSRSGSPGDWGRTVITTYHQFKADRVIGESNYGGDMVENTLRTIDPNVSYKAVQATRGKAIRAEPVVAMYEQGKVHHVGEFEELEDEMTNWVPGSGQSSPNRLDALVWAVTELMGGYHPFRGI